MPRFFVLDGPDLGERFDLFDGDTLGRGAECTATMRHPSVSRIHARLIRDGDAWYLVDLDSRNGLRVNGRAEERVRLYDGDEVLLGKLPLRFRLRETETTEAGSKGYGALGAHRTRPPTATSRVSEGTEDVEIEDEIELAVPSADGAVRTGRRRAVSRPEPVVDVDPEPLDEHSLARAEILRESRRTGLFSSDLEQLPVGLRALLYLLAVVLAGAVFFAAFRAVAFVRGTL